MTKSLNFKLYNGNCLDVLRKCPDNYVDSIITDPPYGLSFMGKKWDYDVPTVDIWKECLRVLKPGGHLLAFGGTRTYHRLVVAIEDAGFEIRDQIQWIYGQGFPKSHNIAKSIDKELGVEATIVGKIAAPASTKRVATMGRPDHSGSGWNEEPDLTVPTSDEAKQWSGWGTALKPANEPICLARKPLSESTIAKNVLKHGTGGLNIDGTRIGTESLSYRTTSYREARTGEFSGQSETNHTTGHKTVEGRFPSNVILDEDAAAVLDEQSGQVRSAGIYKGKATQGREGFLKGNKSPGFGYADKGSASRFFYVAKASKSDRNSGLKGFITWESLDQNLVAQAANSSAQLKAILGGTTLPLNDTEWSTLLFGNSTTDLSQMGLTFTTSTQLKTTTASTILNVLANLTTKESILDAIRMIEENGSNLAESVESINRLKPNITSDVTEYPLGAVRAVLQALLQIRKLAKTENFHATVKPLKLMEYLIKLVTPPRGIVLDPFMGSGTTGVAALRNGFQFRGIEMSEEYFRICQNRIKESEDFDGMA